MDSNNKENEPIPFPNSTAKLTNLNLCIICQKRLKNNKLTSTGEGRKCVIMKTL